MAAQLFNRLGQIGLGLAVGGAVVNNALYNVDGGHRAVIFDRFTGVKSDVVGEGTHFMVILFCPLRGKSARLLHCHMLDSLGAEANYLRHQSEANEHPQHHRIQRFTKRQYHSEDFIQVN